jgi:hypothetical protein
MHSLAHSTQYASPAAVVLPQKKCCSMPSLFSAVATAYLHSFCFKSIIDFACNTNGSGGFTGSGLGPVVGCGATGSDLELVDGPFREPSNLGGSGGGSGGSGGATFDGGSGGVFTKVGGGMAGVSFLLMRVFFGLGVGAVRVRLSTPATTPTVTLSAVAICTWVQPFVLRRSIRGGSSFMLASRTYSAAIL